MSYNYLKVEKIDKILIVTMNRPEVYNAIHSPMHHEMANVWDDFATDPDLWVAILTGEGAKAFSAGNDLKYTSQGGKEKICETGFAGLSLRFNLEKPIIAAVNGFAMGGGFETALACDFIIASENATFALPEVKVGFFAAAGGVQRLTRQIGRNAAVEMLLTGRHIGAKEALSLGIVSKIVEQNKLLSTAIEKASQIVAVSPSAVKATKKILNSMDSDLNLKESLFYSKEVLNELRNTEDFSEGVSAFVEKRTPRWKNR
ncbi:MAG: enoyl-CoA hydratase/carnithine racemase [Paracoccaceae bacterium]|jgi:enoyl-CoA hydratase/carnithine racemase